MKTVFEWFHQVSNNLFLFTFFPTILPRHVSPITIPLIMPHKPRKSEEDERLEKTRTDAIKARLMNRKTKSTTKKPRAKAVATKKPSLTKDIRQSFKEVCCIRRFFRIRDGFLYLPLHFSYISQSAKSPAGSSSQRDQKKLRLVRAAQTATNPKGAQRRRLDNDSNVNPCRPPDLTPPDIIDLSKKAKVGGHRVDTPVPQTRATIAKEAESKEASDTVPLAAIPDISPRRQHRERVAGKREMDVDDEDIDEDWDIDGVTNDKGSHPIIHSNDPAMLLAILDRQRRDAKSQFLSMNRAREKESRETMARWKAVEARQDKAAETQAKLLQFLVEGNRPRNTNNDGAPQSMSLPHFV